MADAPTAIRATVTGRVQGVFFRDATVARAHELGVLGWVRNGEDGASVLQRTRDDQWLLIKRRDR